MFKTSRCVECEAFRSDYDLLAETFHELNTEEQQRYVIAEVSCDIGESSYICNYFSVLSVPEFFVLRPENSYFYIYPTNYEYSYLDLLEFARVEYQDAFTQA